MRHAFVLMISIILGAAVLVGTGLGGYWYWKSAHDKARTAQVPLANELKQLRVDLPENTTNLQDGLIQFTLSLQAHDAQTKTELADMQPQVEDVINRTMRGFSAQELRTQAGVTRLAGTLKDAINGVLPQGRVDAVYFATIVVQ
ncbi:MAG: flagellar basal body-associated FliL family protein [Alicyclobacillus macrosporangiidus]|uniref:flagellar basal body-associated FliL family protein n=1 Tax=Alicyclobacillus macrosporangiidus TaxID=392015 RepID=UPI0026EB00C5|nr:flagellar basal body-associated FliL family protein [Alicyclobacillus macrosporangiidus]MCL6597359.1 flagellar basal body-associated FliL family protein [Alicyclobacillus macrosporangiidus]